jgi:hypothetical protein
VRERCSVEVEPTLALEVLGRDPAVVLTDELLSLRSVLLGQMLVKAGANAVDKSLVERVNASLGASVPVRSPASSSSSAGCSGMSCRLTSTLRGTYPTALDSPTIAP